VPRHWLTDLGNFRELEKVARAVVASTVTRAWRSAGAGNQTLRGREITLKRRPNQSSALPFFLIRSSITPTAWMLDYTEHHGVFACPVSHVQPATPSFPGEKGHSRRHGDYFTSVRGLARPSSLESRRDWSHVLLMLAAKGGWTAQYYTQKILRGLYIHMYIHMYVCKFVQAILMISQH